MSHRSQPDSAQATEARPAGVIDAPHPGRGSPADQGYGAITNGAGLYDRSSAGRLRLAGDDALDLVNRLSTNELATLAAGRIVPTVLTTNKGRMVDVVLVVARGDGLLVFTSPETRRKVADWVDFYTISEDVSVVDVTDETAMLSLAGPASEQVLTRALGPDCPALRQHDFAEVEHAGVAISVARTDSVGVPGFDVIATGAAALREELLDAGAAPVGESALDAVRVERGVPVYGKEISEDYNPLEAGLLDLISFTKGCYVGQEVIARLDTYKKVQKRLVGLLFQGEGLPEPAGKLTVDGRQVGVVTSSVRSPLMRAGIGLGYVGRAFAGPATVLESPDGPARVVELPFRPEVGP